MSKPLHVVTRENKWAIKREGEDEILSKFETQKKAIDAAKELAKEEKADLFIHRSDGTFRDRISYSDIDDQTSEEMVNEDSEAIVTKRAGAISPKAIGADDILPIASRVSWPALLAGLVMTLTVYIGTAILGVCLTLSLASIASAEVLTVFAGVWSALSLLLAIFIGGFVVSRMTVGETEYEPLIYGALLWGLLFAVMPIMVSLGMDLGFGEVNLTQSVMTAPEVNPQDLQDAGLTAEQAEKVNEMFSGNNEAKTYLGTTGAAWMTFVCMLLSLFTSMAGAITGAGPQVRLLTGEEV
ncbi:Hypothetical protein PBC10988_21980 [Planctomycetales bacterium 10988]|nr:Hypothetical protein PBC10988_21980 [Planctomycetales bacterium 10988]